MTWFRATSSRLTLYFARPKSIDYFSTKITTVPLLCVTSIVHVSSTGVTNSFQFVFVLQIPVSDPLFVPNHVLTCFMSRYDLFVAPWYVLRSQLLGLWVVLVDLRGWDPMHVSYVWLSPFTGHLFQVHFIYGRKFYFAAYLLFFTALYLYPDSEIGTSSLCITGFCIHISCTHFTPYKWKVGFMTSSKP